MITCSAFAHVGGWCDRVDCNNLVEFVCYIGGRFVAVNCYIATLAGFSCVVHDLVTFGDVFSYGVLI